MSTLTVKATAERMNVHPNSVFKLIQEGALPAAQIGRAFVLLERDVMNYIEQQIIAQTAARMGGQPVRRRRRGQRQPGASGQS